jgi:hypothetical protein
LLFRPKLKYRLFPLSDRLTKIIIPKLGRCV